MSITLIAAHRLWNGEVMAPELRDRFVRSLGIAGPRPAESCIVAGTLTAATGTMRGWKPHVANDGSHVLFTGHIANRRQLAEELNVSPDNLAQLYARGLAAWGDEVDLRAIGQFATIIISADGEEIRLARSPITAPPLHYVYSQERFIVASFVAAMFATGEVEQRLDEQKIADSLFLNRCDNGRPWFAGVNRLLSGHRARVTRESIEIAKYYDFADIPKVRLKCDRDYELTAMALFEQGVRAALDGFSKPAISLSGGYDSQAVAALVVRQRPGQPLVAFTSVPEAGWDGVIPDFAFGNERPHVEALVAMYPEIKPHWIDAAGLFFEYKTDALFLLSGMPPGATGNLQWVHELSTQARAAGCDVVLGGDWGNTTFSFDGDGALAAMLRRGQWLRLWQEVGHISRRRGVSRFRVLVSQAILPHLPTWLYEKLGQIGLLTIDDPYASWCPLNRDYARKMQVEERARNMGYEFHPRAMISTRYWRDKVMFLAEPDNADNNQAIDMLHGIEFRDPTSYRPFVEFCLGIPDEQYIKAGVTRRLARRMLKGLIPDMVLNEKRTGLQVADWHLRLGRQREYLIAEIDRLAQDSRIAEMLNLAEFKRRLTDWHEPHRPEDVSMLSYGLIRGITTARYIRFVEGQNG